MQSFYGGIRKKKSPFIGFSFGGNVSCLLEGAFTVDWGAEWHVIDVGKAGKFDPAPWKFDDMLL